MNNLTDFEKIIQVTRRAKENAALVQVVTPTRAIASLANFWLDLKWVDELFADDRERILMYRWYNTVFSLRMGTDVD